MGSLFLEKSKIPRRLVHGDAGRCVLYGIYDGLSYKARRWEMRGVMDRKVHQVRACALRRAELQSAAPSYRLLISVGVLKNARSETRNTKRGTDL
jgi:hypothetical protein